MNFKKTAVPPTKKPLFPGYGNEYMGQESKKSVSWITLFIVVVLTFFVAFVLFKNYDRITNWFVSSLDTSSSFVFGQEIETSWIIQSDGDMISYTHTLLVDEDTMFWLKSRTLDLSLYTWVVFVEWIIERELQEVFILEVYSISWALITWNEVDDVWTGVWTYVSVAAVYLPADFSTKYTLLNRWENGVLRFQNTVTNQIIPVSYFTCKASDPNKHCTQLQQNISSTAEKSFSTSYWVTAYKLEGITSWFFTNGSTYGYFINDVADQEVQDLVNAFILPTEYYIKNTRLSKMESLCGDDVTSLMQITSYTLSVDTNGLVITLQWPTEDGSASCKLFIDPSQALWATKISYITNTASTTTTTSSSTDSSSFVASTPDFDTSVKQFPIDLEKALTFTSSRGYSIVFPSSNIAYAAINVNDDLGLPGVRCSSQMNVTRFADKDTLHDDPKVSIFLCNIQGTLNNLWNTMIQTSNDEWVQFIIKILDSAWYDFAMNISVK